MALFDGFDLSSPEFISPFDAVQKVEDFPETVIVTFSERIAKTVLSVFNCTKISSMRAGWEIPIYGFIYKDTPLCFYQTPLCGPAAVTMLEEATAKGGKNFLFFGSCGVLDGNIKAGTLLLPTDAYRDEGTSFHYAPPGDFIKVNTAERLCGIFDELNIEYEKVKTWTTDAFYRETRAKVRKVYELGCRAVEMECASIMSQGQYRGTNVYEFLFAADSLGDKAWGRRILGNVSTEFYDSILNIALETAVRL